MLEFEAIWDTGATGCVITQGVVDACGLISTGRQKVTGVHGESEVDTFLVNIFLPNEVGFSGVPVTIGNLGENADVLIGMSIINRGDFAVTNVNAITKFSFRVPSEANIDFVVEGQRKQLTQQFQHGGSSNARKKKPRPAKSRRRK